MSGRLYLWVWPSEYWVRLGKLPIMKFLTKGLICLLFTSCPISIWTCQGSKLIICDAGYTGVTGSEIQRESGNLFSQRFWSTTLQESIWILINISVYPTKLWRESMDSGKIPLGESKWIHGFSHLVANFWPRVMRWQSKQMYIICTMSHLYVQRVYSWNYGTQQNSHSISHLLGTVTTQWLPLWRYSHCSLVPDTVTTQQWLHRTHTLLGIHYHGAYVETCLLGT